MEKKSFQRMKRAAAFFLALCMTVGILPMHPPAYAAETTLTIDGVTDYEALTPYSQYPLELTNGVVTYSADDGIEEYKVTANLVPNSAAVYTPDEIEFKEDGVEFSGTMNSALITTEKNKTILIQCCMTLPRPYSRSYMISGTKGYVQKYPVHSMSFAPDSDNIFIGEQCDSIIGRHRHTFVEKYAKRGKELCGKRWIDFAMDERLIYCLRNGLPLDMDVYDAAEWSSLVELTEQSALAGGAPVEIPDFTRGRWDVLKGVEFAE